MSIKFEKYKFGFYYYLFGLTLLLSNPIQAQQDTAIIDEKLFEKLALYSKANPDNLLFVHTDKTLYANNETLWFSAYIIKTSQNIIDKHEVLSVALMKEDSRKVLITADFIMQNGLGFGSLSIPDSIPPGHYQLMAYTNVQNKEGEPEAVFYQSLTFKSLTEQVFSSTLTLLDTTLNKGSVRAKVSVSFNYPNPKEQQKAILSYSIGEKEVKNILLKDNSYIINIPASQITGLKPVLLTTIRYKKQVQYLSTELPATEIKGMKLRFFPEGGSLLKQTESTIAWETRTPYEVPLSVRGILYSNGKPIDTLTTSSTGMGKFKLRPQHNIKYTLKILANNYLQKDSVFNLPHVLDDGIVLHLPSAVVNDTLKVRLTANRDKKVRVVIHNFREAFASFDATIGPETGRFSVFLPLIVKGISSITILDDEGRPLAERLFFARYKDQLSLAVKADQPVYGKKNKVTLNLQLKDKDGNAKPGIVSIAAVQDNRLERSKFQDIENYVYLNHHLGDLPIPISGRGIKDKAYLEEILLVKGWRNYTWQKVINTTLNDTIQQSYFPEIKGKVSYRNKPLKDSVVVSLIKDSKIGFVNTLKDGSFTLKPEDILFEEGRSMLATVNKKNNYGYSVEINTPFKESTAKLATKLQLPIRGFANGVQSSKDLEIKGMERAIALQAVVVTASTTDNSIYRSSNMGQNACGDYVCSYNILNCRNHFGDYRNTMPVKGRIYRGSIGRYAGCMIEEEQNKTIFKLDGIYTAREFYGVNMDPDGLLEPQYLSTLYWKPGYLINKDGIAAFSFYTGDITGKFRVVVQGLSVNDVLYGETSFEVK